MVLNKSFIVILISVILASCKAGAPQLGKDSVEEVVSALTLEEKVRLVVGTAKMHPNPPYPAPGTFMRPPIPEGGDVNTFSTRVKVKGAAGDGYAVPRLNIPSLVYADGPAGVRIDPERENDPQKYYATAFPIATLLASSWDTSLVKQVGEAMGNEVLEYGVDILLAPGMNIQRNPLTGRNFEYYSEDPLLAGRIAAAMVKGIQSNGVGTSIKHFAANNQETFRNGIDVVLSERALREIYLKGFEIAIKESEPWTVMSSYNKINGVYASESYDLLTKVLRDEWGYKGFVLTDWWAEHDPVAQMKAGNDLLMPGTEEQIQLITEAVNSEVLDVKLLDRNVANILRVVEQSPSMKQYAYSNRPDLERHAQLVREAAAEGMILLENKENTLPLNTNLQKVALFGVGAYDAIVGGSGSGYVYRTHKISMADAFQKAGWIVDNELGGRYRDYISQTKAALPAENFWHVPVVPEMSLGKEYIAYVAERTDVAIFTIGRNSGEGDDRKQAKGDYYLSDLEVGLLRDVCREFKKQNKKVIVVLTVGGVMEMTDWKDWADAVLLAWLPGQEAGYSIVDVLSGKTTPSGKLPMTFPRRYGDIPSAKNFPWSDDNPSKVEYEEDIFVGYRYYNRFGVEPLYEFGYGLSYTEFEYKDLLVVAQEDNGDISVSVTIANKGDIAGKEVVQLYVTAPESSILKPAEELRAFAKTKLLLPGEEERLTFRLNFDDFASYHEDRASWIVDAGIYILKIGASSKDLRLAKELHKMTPSQKQLENVLPKKQ